MLIDQCQDETPDKVRGAIGARGTGKSSIEVQAYLIWCMVTSRYQFNVLVKEDEQVLKVAIKNIRSEIEENEDIKRDFDIEFQKVNPFTKKKISEKWTDTLLSVKGNILMGRTIGQNVRGLNFRTDDGDLIRPQNVVCDDIENPEKAKKKENRAKISRLFYSEIFSGRDIKDGIKILNVGNLVHKESLLMKQFKGGDDIVIVPLVRNGEPANKFMHPTMKDIYKIRDIILRDPSQGKSVWLREFMLKLVNEDDMIVKEEDFHYYTPEQWDNSKLIQVVTGVDLAISQKETADFTTMVTAWLRKLSQEHEADAKRRKRIFITPDFIKKRMTFAETVQAGVKKFKRLPIGNKFLVENNQYQQAVVETFKNHGIRTDGVRAVKDKRAKLETIAPFIVDGTILFHPECKEIVDQLLDFGIDDHDDLLDALVYACTTLIHKKNVTLAITSI